MDKSLSYVVLAGILATAACSSATQDLGNSDKGLTTPDGGSPSNPTTPTTPVPEAGSDAGDSGSAPNPGAKRVFVTSLTYSGDLATEGKAATGSLGADNICNEHAKAANLGGSWVAWVSTSTEDAIDRVPDVGPWYFVDRTTKVFPSRFYIKDGPLVPLVIDERGLTLEGPGLLRLYVWTGTDNSGRYDVRPRYYAQGVSFPISGCSDWTSAASGSVGGVHARASYGQASTANWTDSGTGYDGSSTDCSQRLHLYCFEK